jgi:3-hydroxyisobutyrate dehydrogenase-like beta-hydroxyacid dehydrogenase
MAKVALLGTGLLGAGFAENLLAKGHTVTVWNRTRAKAEPLAAKGATVVETPAAAVAGVERVHLVLTADDAVDAVIGALLPALGDGAWLFDHSTNAPARVRTRVAALHARGVRYLHAPVFMGPQNAREATGLMLLSATDEDAAAVRPALEAMTGTLWHVGNRPDLAAIYKLQGNGLLVSLSGALGDLLAQGAAQGLSAQESLALFDVFKPGGAIPFFGARVARKGEMAPSWELAMARKDVGLMLEQAGGPDGLVVLPAIARAMDDALAQGHADRDYSIFAWPRARG